MDDVTDIPKGTGTAPTPTTLIGADEEGVVQSAQTLRPAQDDAGHNRSYPKTKPGRSYLPLILAAVAIIAAGLLIGTRR